MYFGNVSILLHCKIEFLPGKAVFENDGAIQRQAQSILIFVQFVVGLPEESSTPGILSGDRCTQCMGVSGGQREVTEHKQQVIAKMLLQILDHPISFTAIGTFIVAKFDQGDLGMRTSLAMVVGTYRDFESGHLITC
ncbi:hypothetical protein BGP84_14135 [Pseudomonas putida]|uniref:Uncharacterized protein n=1 Tax=Pseudomonas putida TaxID=303 RepID=A0A2S3X5H8_PSEPU|nr:hypothetical protein AYO71_15535 [Pseudomonas koreensis]ERT19796.1 hypothetical protein O162_03760 [Pseudomonas putida SJ3]POG10814.1 hypothetical protein BGP84_14135 [Pseudomonas putida]POG15277.1 hypothetical protein BGP85_03595 [Pseudomonas putida]